VPNYTLRDGETVKNKLGATLHSELEDMEVDFVNARQIEHAFDPHIAHTFDAAHLKAIHLFTGSFSRMSMNGLVDRATNRCLSQMVRSHRSLCYTDPAVSLLRLARRSATV
jgi:hypothetical protein